jgi:hypothetical protein
MPWGILPYYCGNGVVLIYEKTGLFSWLDVVILGDFVLWGL